MGENGYGRCALAVEMGWWAGKIRESQVGEGEGGGLKSGFPSTARHVAKTRGECRSVGWAKTKKGGRNAKKLYPFALGETQGLRKDEPEPAG